MPVLPAPPANLQQRLDIEAQYLNAELGSRSIDLLPSTTPGQIAYCLHGCLSLDRWWHANRVPIASLPQTPVDLQSALGATAATPDLVTHYYLGDELILSDGKISYRLNDGTEVNFCLNNPSLSVTAPTQCTTRYEFAAPSGTIQWVHALEKDLYEQRSQLTNVVPGLSERRSSGTILVASKISIVSKIETGGYDLVLVANDVVFEPGGEIVTTPPPRIDGATTFANSPGYYDYGHGQQGYRGGDVVVFARNVEGEVRARTQGGKGQRRAVDFPISFSFTNPDKWETSLAQFTPSAEIIQTLPQGTLFYKSHHLWEIGDLGRGGAGGPPGNVTLVATDGDKVGARIRQSGGDGSDTASSALPSAGTTTTGTTEPLNSFSYGAPVALARQELGPGPWANCPASILTGLILNATGTRICTATQPYVHDNCNIQSLLGNALFFCAHLHSQYDDVGLVAYTAIVLSPDPNGAPFGFWGFNLRLPEDEAVALDYDGDRRDDLLFYRPGSGGAMLLHSTGDGSFTTAVTSVGAPLMPGAGFALVPLANVEDRFIALDYDGDHKDDLLFYRPGSGAVTLLRSVGNGSFTKVMDVPGTPGAPGAGLAGFDLHNPADVVISLDYNHDDLSDLLFFRPAAGVLWLAKSNGDGTFTKVFGGGAVTGGGPGVAGVTLGDAAMHVVPVDFDDDGDDDLFFYTAGVGAVALARSDANGRFDALFNFTGSVSDRGPGLSGFSFARATDRAVALDMNRDSRGDLLMYSPGTGAATAVLSRGDATWATAFRTTSTSTKVGPGIAGFDLWHSRDRIVPLDYNGDGYGDLLLFRPGYGDATLATVEGTWLPPSTTHMAAQITAPEAPTTCGALNCTCPVGYTLVGGRCFLDTPSPLPSNALNRNESGIIVRPDWPGRAVGKSGRFGPNNGTYARYFVAAPVNFLAYPGGSSSFVSDAAPSAGSCPGPACITPIGFAQLIASLAPRAAEVMALKGDMLFRSLSDNSLLANDAAYVANSTVNPLHVNRVDKARYYYAAAEFYCVDDMVAANATSSNPFWADCQYALAQKRRLESNLNYFGFVPGGFIYAQPHLVHQYFLQLRDYLVLRRNGFSQAVADLDNATRNHIDAGVDLQTRIFERAQAVAALAIADEQARSIGLRLDNALERIDETSTQIATTQDEIADALARIEELTEPPPCDALCWAGRIFDIVVAVANIVANVYSFNWGALGTSLKSAVDLIKTAATVVEGIKAIGEYASLLINGKNGTVKFEVETGGTAELNVTDAAFKKDVIDRAKAIYDNANKLITDVETIRHDGENPLAASIATIRANALTVGANVQDNLTQIYQLQGALESSGENEALAEARSLEDRAKYIQGLNRQTPDHQRLHVEAAAEMVVATLSRSVSEARIAQATTSEALQAATLARYVGAVTNGEVMVDASCRSARAISDLALLMQYLYDRSVAYLKLEAGATNDFTRTALLQSDFDAMVAQDVSAILTNFVNNVLKPAAQPSVVTEIIAPVSHAVTVTVGTSGSTYQFTARNNAARQSAMCPGGTRPCALTRESYQEEVVQSLRVNGRADFEFVPYSDARFRDMPLTERRAWNVGLTTAEATGHPNRVLDVSARILLDNWQLPTVTAVSSVTLSHGPMAQFVVNTAGATKDVALSSDPMRTACLSIGAILVTDLGCSGISFFERRISSPFTEIATTYQNLSTINVSAFQSAAMFGTSIRGKWTINIQDVLDQLQTYQAGNPSYNGCTASDPCTAVESFWRKFRGIEVKAFWVSTS